MDPLVFSKYEGLGNDFIVVDAPDEDFLSPEKASLLCDRRRGVGGDGVLLVLPPARADSAARMRVINSDGSVPEMCGNGVRCLALHLALSRKLAAGTLLIDTDVGTRACAFERAGDCAHVSVDMGTVQVLGERELDVDGRQLTVTTADVGNPHAVLLGRFARGDIERIGPRIATHAEFPRGTNVEFAHVEDGAVDLVVWERGVGLTLACGTGACAAVAVAAVRGLVARAAPVPVRLPGGALDVTVLPQGKVLLRGPARHVFSGRIAPSQLGPTNDHPGRRA